MGSPNGCRGGSIAGGWTSVGQTLLFVALGLRGCMMRGNAGSRDSQPVDMAALESGCGWWLVGWVAG